MLKASALKSDNNRYLIPGPAPNANSFNPEPIFFRVSDTLFMDDLSTRSSLDSYLFKLFRMLIDWKATKQQ